MRTWRFNRDHLDQTIINVIAGIIVAFFGGLAVRLMGGVTQAAAIIADNLSIIILLILEAAIVLFMVWILVRRFLRQIRDIVEPHSLLVVGAFRAINIGAVLNYETIAREVLVITDSFKFEQLVGSGMLELVRKNIDKEQAENAKLRREGKPMLPSRYRFIFPDSQYDKMIIFLSDEMLYGLDVQRFIRDHTARIEDRYFDVLRPFPERTYVFEDGTAKVCDLFVNVGGTVTAYEMSESVPSNVDRFRRSYLSFFTS